MREESRTIDDNELVFYVDWDDPTVGIARKFLLTYYPKDNSVEMFDIKMKRLFLKRIQCETVCKSDFYLGNIVVIFSRRLMIKDYGNKETQNLLEFSIEVTCLLVHSEGLSELGLLINYIYEKGFSLGRAKMMKLDKTITTSYYLLQGYNADEESFANRITSLISGPAVAIEVMGFEVVKTWKTCPNQFEHITLSLTKKSALEELNLFFPNIKCQTTRASSLCSNSTCCIIKPHALKNGLAGSIIADIQSKSEFKITGLDTFHLQNGNAEEFLEIYKGITQDYNSMVKELSSGRCMVLEISPAYSEVNINEFEVVSKFREIVGPVDPQICRALRPYSLRAKYGLNRDQNAIHCTDLPEDGILEIEYFFKILQ